MLRTPVAEALGAASAASEIGVGNSKIPSGTFYG